MSGFSEIKLFGNLTTQNGTKIDYKYLLNKYDADKDGEISTDELETALKKEKLDSIDIDEINTNGDKTIDKDEMAVYEQKYKMQETINTMIKEIANDFGGTKSQYIPQVTLELTNYIMEFSESYKGDTSNMAKEFSAKLPTKYAQIKADVLKNDPSSFKSTVIDSVLSYIKSSETDYTQAIRVSDSAMTKLGKLLDEEATKYIKANPKCTSSELKSHLNEYMSKSDADRLSSAAAKYKNSASSYGYVDSDELNSLKEDVKEFLTEAVNQGITVKLGNSNIATTNAITSVLKGYTDGEKLKSDMETAIAALSTISKKDAIIKQDKTEQAEAIEKQFTDISGSSYKVNASLIDYSQIEGYHDGSTITVKKKKKVSELTEAVQDQLSERLEKSLKPQLKQQIKKMLQEKGISFDKIEQVFENVYNTSFTEVFNSEGMLYTKHKTAFHRGEASVNVKDFVDKFVTTFNTNIEKSIDEMNASNTDMDIVDLDFTQAGKDDTGNAIKDETTGEDLSTLYASGQTITTKKHGADYYVSIAEAMVDRMEKQMRAKAEAMCKANGVEFDESAFKTMFSNAKGTAVNSAVTGIAAGDKVGKSIGLGSASGAIAIGASSGIVFGTTFGATAGAIVGPIGAAVGAVVGTIIGGIAGLFTGHHSSSSLNVRTLLDTFTETFKENYSNWVATDAKEKEEEK